MKQNEPGLSIKFSSSYPVFLYVLGACFPCSYACIWPVLELLFCSFEAASCTTALLSFGFQPSSAPCSYTYFLRSRRNLLSSSNYCNSKTIANSSCSNISFSNLLSLASNPKAQINFFNKRSQELEIWLVTVACQTLLGENKYVSVVYLWCLFSSFCMAVQT